MPHDPASYNNSRSEKQTEKNIGHFKGAHPSAGPIRSRPLDSSLLSSSLSHPENHYAVLLELRGGFHTWRSIAMRQYYVWSDNWKSMQRSVGCTNLCLQACAGIMHHWYISCRAEPEDTSTSKLNWVLKGSNASSTWISNPNNDCWLHFWQTMRRMY